MFGPRRAAPLFTAARRPLLLLHAGLHKTGTTALQEALAAQQQALLGQGVLFVRAGRPVSAAGQHNLAWQLMRDRRYHSAWGTIDEAAREIAAHGGHAIISAEDFETFLDRPEIFAPLTRHPALAGHEIGLLVYLREPCAYLRSLYLELTQAGIAEEARLVIAQILAAGHFDLREWRFQFDYARLAAVLRRGFPGRVVLRDYQALIGGSSLSDFRHVTGLRLDEFDDKRLNIARAPGDALRDFYAARLALPLTEAQLAQIAALAAALGEQAPGLSAASLARLAARFGPARRSLRRFGVGRDWAVPKAETRPGMTLEALFSFETQCRLMGAEA